MKHYIRLDVSIKRNFICAISEYGEIIREGSEKIDPHFIAEYLEKLGLESVS
jgi:arginyl-tRNA synthetase